MTTIYINLNTYGVVVSDENGNRVVVERGQAVEGGHYQQYALNGMLTPIEKHQVRPSNIVAVQDSPPIAIVVAPLEVVPVAPAEVAETAVTEETHADKIEELTKDIEQRNEAQGKDQSEPEEEEAPAAPKKASKKKA